jgi:hypothetical protein
MKYLTNALKNQLTNEASFNDSWNIENLGTDRQTLNLVKQARNSKFGPFDNRSKITKKDFLEWHRVFLLENKKAAS